jgi:hypothetical protein
MFLPDLRGISLSDPQVFLDSSRHKQYLLGIFRQLLRSAHLPCPAQTKNSQSTRSIQKWYPRHILNRASHNTTYKDWEHKHFQRFNRHTLETPWVDVGRTCTSAITSSGFTSSIFTTSELKISISISVSPSTVRSTWVLLVSFVNVMRRGWPTAAVQHFHKPHES